MTTFKLTPTQKRELLAGIVTYKVKRNEDIIPYVGRNLGDFNYLDLLEEFYLEPFVSREISDLYMASKYKEPHTPSVSWTKTKIKKYSKLTDMEGQVFDFLLDELAMWIGGEDYSPVDTQDIVEGTGIPANKLRGVLSSLEQKNILENYEHDNLENSNKRNWITLWLFVNQVELSREDLIKKVS